VAWKGRCIGALLLCCGLANADPAVTRVADPVAEGTQINEIWISGNTKTRDDVVRFVARARVGEPYTRALVERVRKDLETSQLFREVSVSADQSWEYGGARLVIRVRDKQSWIIAPTVYTSPGNKGFGLAYGDNNLVGTGKKLLVYGQVATLDTFLLLGYYEPTIPKTDLYDAAYVYLRSTHSTEYSSPGVASKNPKPVRDAQFSYWNLGLILGAYAGRRFTIDGRLRGAYVDFGSAKWASDVDPLRLGFPLRPRAPEVSGWDISTLWRVSNDTTTGWEGVLHGRLLRLSFEKSLPWISTYDYWLAGFTYRQYWRFFRTHNLMLQTGLAMGWHLPYQQEITAGGPDLRGYTSEQFRGDAQVTNTLEYSFQIFWLGPFAFRGLVFWDTAFTTFVNTSGNTQRNYLPGETETTAAQWRNGVGVGFRVYVKSIIMPLVGVDVGCGVEVRDCHVYLAVGLTNLD
jgi:outer membrane protein assembly factor BamA